MERWVWIKGLWRTGASLLLMPGLLLVACGRSERGEHGQATDGAGVTRVSIRSRVTYGMWNPLLLGSNLEWTDHGDGLWDPRANAFSGALMALIRLVPVPLLRFPGGAMASTYVWERGIGPRELRGEGPDFSGNPQKMLMGTDEYLALLQTLGARGLITLNPRAPLESQVAWVRYIRQHSPGAVCAWEWGNEPYLAVGPGYMSARAYAEGFLKASAVLRGTWPDIKLGAVLQAGLEDLSWIGRVVPEAATWNETVLSLCGREADFFTVHFYSPYVSKGPKEEVLTAMLSGPVLAEKALEGIRKAIDARNPGRPVWVTEYNVLTDEAVGNWTFGTSMAQTTFGAQMVMAFARQKVGAACYWSLSCNHNFGMISGPQNPLIRPAGKLFEDLASLRGAELLAVDVAAPPMRVPPVGNVEDLGIVPMMDALAFRKEGKLGLLLINRSPGRALRVRLEVDGKPLADLRGLAFFSKSPMDSWDREPFVPRPWKALGGVVLLPPAATLLLRENP